MDLREEVLKYKISESQLKEYSNDAIETYKQKKNKVNNNFYLVLYSSISFLLVFLLGVFALLANSADNLTATNLISGIFFLLIILFCFLLSTIYLKKLNKNKKEVYQKYKKYFEIEKNVNNFNFTVDEIEALLNSPKASKNLPDGKKILEVLDTIRGDLVSALKLERLYRENPNYKYNRKLNVDLTSDDHFMELMNRNDIQGNEMNELLTKWQEIREAINNM